MEDEVSFHRLAELELNEAAVYYELETRTRRTLLERD